MSDDTAFVERLGERHFPWWYFAYGNTCACGRPCDRNDDCEVMRRARRWAATTETPLAASAQPGPVRAAAGNSCRASPPPTKDKRPDMGPGRSQVS